MMMMMMITRPTTEAMYQTACSYNRYHWDAECAISGTSSEMPHINISCQNILKLLSKVVCIGKYTIC